MKIDKFLSWSSWSDIGIGIHNPRSVYKIPIERPEGISDEEWNTRLIKVERLVDEYNKEIDEKEKLEEISRNADLDLEKA